MSAFFHRTIRPLLLLLPLLALSLHGVAQTAPSGRLNQLENARIAYLTEKVSLTQEQAQQFWPIYNEYATKRRDLNQRSRQLRTTRPETLSDQQLKDNLNQVLALRQQEVDLDKDYLRQFQKVLSIRQVSQLYTAERQFTREVLQRVTRSRRR
ncbi:MULTISPECIES: Spy/CpxP family protein refolding chaperone [Hymenobacter]|uniref:Sensor of ECF-type sigma factor n=1 Tax=Hymenobacter profundi TaxID=1982110 RepID=A0ABS6WWF3_9BACT|nr:MULTISPECIES: Spy/CpxP family protein refolding chaperone [Hymenobacter]MBW3127793.1 hypothetical protein [Hymenobacter profundi]